MHPLHLQQALVTSKLLESVLGNSETRIWVQSSMMLGQKALCAKYSGSPPLLFEPNLIDPKVAVRYSTMISNPAKRNGCREGP